VLEVGLSLDEIGERIERRFSRPDRPTGVIALTNFATMGVIAAFNRLAVAVPEDVSLIGFDDYAWMRISSPSITAIAQPIEQMADVAWAQLKARIAGDETPPVRPKLDCRLEIRQSTRAVGPPLSTHDPRTLKQA
jgi:LacI family transcriptional regulator